ncbi:ABC transporter ATP-binding protein [Paenibacillus apiarius]|uniref:ABC transporter ATP-binding protein n=1 Tax=Paenibacillus apiarius TaxID=46240 RepID=A0ABT4DVW5_9BACL|nr:ABC transporter ATP-binding protein [Paenibacillus apiarius]MCY9514120.1 ABC transporter ATP-binding protein [Paenibacillus apiarius]MCY9520243.1 ABC transporter ATP-binding protein [Paenibacillus apiarius]MCY9550415.1 ABC transporter ATP-binding protein [Paenibacillus apiarius]MCY9557477.1 ABC transporter ATP-binding protein [Paenibacillus apiarius]MCY9682344.1 ABC transporter ATP-binding protein [Paenibacillus apiarius]
MLETAIKVNQVSKVYKLYSKPIDRLKEALNPFRKKYHNEFAALHDITFQVSKGEIVGILGTNGSGKSTILKIITGLLNPTEGNVEVNGKISALLELGAGFNHEFTGIENIYLNGTMMGLSKEEIDGKIADIIKFADIGDFVNQPVKMYSSGMFARLAFAVSINVDPDILIIDEALAVGDMYFQEKCYEKMKEMVRQGATILFVSHSLPAIRNFCERAVWIEKGVLKAQGKADEVCDKYKQFIESKDDLVKSNFVLKDIDIALKYKNKIYLKSVKMNKKRFVTGEDILFDLELDFRKSDLKYGVGLIIYNIKGEIVTLFNTIRDDLMLDSPFRNIKLTIPENDLVSGKYFVSVHISDEMVMYSYDKNDYIDEFEIIDRKNSIGMPIAEGHFRSKHYWDYH